MKNRIKKIRIKKGIKLIELAELSNLSNGYISHLENGRRDNPSYKTMIKIAKALKEDVSEIFNLNNL